MPTTSPVHRATRSRIALLAVGALLGSAAVASPAAATGAPTRVELRTALQRLVASGVPGVTVRVQRGRRVSTETVGLAVVRPRRALRPTDRFRIASETKTFVATVVLQLVAEGRIALDASVESLLPGMVPNGAAITVRQLLGMTSGLPDYLASDPAAIMGPLRDPAFAWSAPALIAVSTKLAPEFAPGTSWSYSNANYLLLDLIVEHVTGRSIGDELRTRIFEPLGLLSTSYPSMTDRSLPVPHADGYVLTAAGGRTNETATSPSMAGAAGAIISTTADVSRFFRALNAGRLLPAGVLREMRSPTPKSPGYGLGLFTVHPPGCGKVWGHNGEIQGFQSFTMTTPDGRVSASLLMNGSGPFATGFDLPARPSAAKEAVLALLACAASQGIRR